MRPQNWIVFDDPAAGFDVLFLAVERGAGTGGERISFRADSYGEWMQQFTALPSQCWPYPPETARGDALAVMPISSSTATGTALIRLARVGMGGVVRWNRDVEVFGPTPYFSAGTTTA